MNEAPLPPVHESIAYARSLGKPTVAELLEHAASSGWPLVQPRCGVGHHELMRRLLVGLEERAAPEVLTLTIDSHTRLLQFESVRRTLNADPSMLNGYPLVTHGWKRGRELNEAVRAPIQVRHGSPDPRLLFETSIVAGITSFEGGGVAYNVPYVKNVPIKQSLLSWQEVDRLAGEVTGAGLTVDRELFGALTAVLMPPSICLAVTLLEAVLAAAQGVRCLSIAYPQGGHLWQDLAALRAIPQLAQRYLGLSGGTDAIRVHTVLHQFMGMFPASRASAAALITYGGLTAALGKVAKVVTKSPAEAWGVPTLAENVEGLRLTRIGMTRSFDCVPIDEAKVAEEQAAIEREVHELVDPVLERPNLIDAIDAAFAAGRLDVPFSASRYARSGVIPCRDAEGAIRFRDIGGLPFRMETRRRNDRLVAARIHGRTALDTLLEDIAHFSAAERPWPAARWGVTT